MHQRGWLIRRKTIPDACRMYRPHPILMKMIRWLYIESDLSDIRLIHIRFIEGLLYIPVHFTATVWRLPASASILKNSLPSEPNRT